MREKKMIKIVVCLKVAHQLCSERGFDAVKKRVDPDCLVRVVNPADEYALETALLLKERMETEIITVSISPPADEEILRRCFAMGIDHAYRVWDEGFDTLNAMAIAYLLSVCIRRIGGDLILCGKKAIDVNGNEVGGYLAEFLSLPQIPEVAAIDVSKGSNRFICRRRVERMGWDLVETSLPVVLTVDRGENEPRYPNIFSVLTWLGKEIHVLDKTSLEIDTARLEEWNSMVRVLDWSRPKPKKVFTPKSDLPPEERIKLALTGGLDQKSAKILSGDTKEAVSQVVDLLIKQKFFRIDGAAG
jgi:electron transfer flavoprotein beta subunit